MLKLSLQKELEQFKHSLQKKYSQYLEQLSWNSKIRERAAKVAEYLAVARQLKAEDPSEMYIRANQLSWELALWLPEDIYREATTALSSPNGACNERTTVISVRKLLLKEEAGELDSGSIAFHAPNIAAAARNKSTP